MFIKDIIFFEDAQEPRSPEQQYAVDNARVTRTFQRREPAGINELDRFNAARALIGYPQLVRVNTLGGGTVLYISRTLPVAYPAPQDLATLGLNYLWTTAITRTAPEGAVMGTDGNGAPIYPCVRFTTQANILPYIIRDDESVKSGRAPLFGYPDEGQALSLGWLSNSRFVSRQWRPGSHTYTLPQGFMKRFDTGDPVPQAVPWHSSEGTVRYTWHQVPVIAIPETAMFQTFNCVNHEKFDGRERGTLLLKEAEMTQYQNALGIWLADITYTMGYMPNFDQVSQKFRGWNSRLMVMPAGGFGYVWTSADGNEPATDPGVSNNAAYPFRDFTALFRPDQ